jgi:hypothetical protein
MFQIDFSFRTRGQQVEEVTRWGTREKVSKSYFIKSSMFQNNNDFSKIIF